MAAVMGQPASCTVQTLWGLAGLCWFLPALSQGPGTCPLLLVCDSTNITAARSQAPG